MSILKILTFPAKSLKQPSVEVKSIDEDIKQLVKDMGQTMFDAPGVGLAAPQVGVNKRIIVYDINADNPDHDGSKDQYKALINPQIIESFGSMVSENEACLSVVDYKADVKRFEKIIVKALDIDNNEITIKTQGKLSVILQHEIDHLDGVLYIDRISMLKRSIYKKKLAKKMSS